MATETLGQRIMDAALEWAGVWARVKADDRDSFEDEDEAHERLRALAARADAAERLAVADAAYVDVCRENAHCQDHEVQDTWELWCARRDARTAWRAITEGEVDVCRWPAQGVEPRVTSCGRRIAFNLASDGEPCPSCGGRIVEVDG